MFWIKNKYTGRNHIFDVDTILRVDMVRTWPWPWPRSDTTIVIHFEYPVRQEDLRVLRLRFETPEEADMTFDCLKMAMKERREQLTQM